MGSSAARGCGLLQIPLRPRGRPASAIVTAESCRATRVTLFPQKILSSLVDAPMPLKRGEGCRAQTSPRTGSADPKVTSTALPTCPLGASSQGCLSATSCFCPPLLSVYEQRATLCVRLAGNAVLKPASYLICKPRSGSCAEARSIVVSKHSCLLEGHTVNVRWMAGILTAYRFLRKHCFLVSGYTPSTPGDDNVNAQMESNFCHSIK